MRNFSIIIIFSSFLFISYGQSDSISKNSNTNKADKKKINSMQTTKAMVEINPIGIFEFKNKNQSIIKKYKNDTSLIIEYIHLVYYKQSDNETIDINISDEYITSKPTDIFLISKSINLKITQNITDTLLPILIGIVNDKKIECKQTVYKLIASIDKKTAYTYITVKNALDPHKPDFKDFMIHAGANFDFKDGVKINTFYGKISFFKPGLTLNNRIGFYSNIYQNNIVSNDSNLFGHDIKTLSNINDTISYVSNFIKYNNNQSNKNIALCIGVPLQVLPWDRKGKSDAFKFFISPEFELIKVNTTNSREFTLISSDTILNTTTSFYLSDISSKRIISVAQQFDSYTTYLKHFGIGTVLLTYETDKSFIYLSGTVWGFGYVNNKVRAKQYYQYKLQISEKKYGISLGCEFRGFYQEDPFISIHLSKIFDLSKLSDFNNK
ncbi:MAG: hypothetical protein K9J13_03600 [Saprospiraceae bacterium]|nr:hypothetical protein [Saprospiraceae bacterium]